MTKKTILLTAFMALALSVGAMPAKKGAKKMIRLADGTSVLAELKGDEFKSYWQAADGKCFSLDPDKKVFKEIDLASFSPAFSEKRDLINKSRVKRLNKVASRASLGGDHLEYKGKKKGLIILAQYKDKKFKSYHDLAYYKDLANKPGFSTAYGHVGSVRDYFLAQSNGEFELDFDVVGPVELPNNYAYYGAHSKNGDNDSKPGTMVAQACKLADEKFGVNFADYDWDGDGEVEQVYVLYAGQGEAAGGDEDTVWPHEFVLSSSDWGSALSLDGVKIDTYACGSEQSITVVYNHFTGTYKVKEFPDGIGTICHEFSHCLGFPDMYDVNYGGNYGMGCWDLMDQGSYNGEGRGYCPANFTAYEKMYAGWLQPIALDKATTIKGVKSASDYGQTFVVYNEANNNECYLLENRQLTGWDAALPGHGLMITHLDYDPNIWQMNNVNTIVNYSGTYGDQYAIYDNDHQRCTIFHADNTTKDDTKALYPITGNNSLTDTSEPAAAVYNAKADGSLLMGKPITNITQNDDGTIGFDFMGGSDNNIIDAIENITIQQPSKFTGYYTLDGRYAGSSFSSLPKGVYVTNGKKIIK